MNVDYVMCVYSGKGRRGVCFYLRRSLENFIQFHTHSWNVSSSARICVCCIYMNYKINKGDNVEARVSCNWSRNPTLTQTGNQDIWILIYMEYIYLNTLCILVYEN